MDTSATAPPAEAKPYELPLARSARSIGHSALVLWLVAESESTLSAYSLDGRLGEMIGDVLDGLSKSNGGDNTAAEEAVKARVIALCEKFPIYRA